MNPRNRKDDGWYNMGKRKRAKYLEAAASLYGNAPDLKGEELAPSGEKISKSQGMTDEDATTSE